MLPIVLIYAFIFQYKYYVNGNNYQKYSVLLLNRIFEIMNLHTKKSNVDRKKILLNYKQIISGSTMIEKTVLIKKKKKFQSKIFSLKVVVQSKFCIDSIIFLLDQHNFFFCAYEAFLFQ